MIVSWWASFVARDLGVLVTCPSVVFMPAIFIRGEFGVVFVVVVVLGKVGSISCCRRCVVVLIIAARFFSASLFFSTILL